MSPDEVELHAKAAKRQFGRLGRDHSHIDPLTMRAAAEAALKEARVEMSAPATKADIEELKRLILSMQPAAQNVNVTWDSVDAFSRLRGQIAGAHHVR